MNEWLESAEIALRNAKQADADKNYRRAVYWGRCGEYALRRFSEEAENADPNKPINRLAGPVVAAVERWLTVIDSCDATNERTRDALDGIAHAYASHSGPRAVQE